VYGGDDVTTLRTNLNLVAGKALGSDLVTTLTQTILSVRRDLMHEEPIFAQITAPSTDQDAGYVIGIGNAARVREPKAGPDGRSP
jgi:hypothetical protein